jgi:hypothetical protein
MVPGQMSGSHLSMVELIDGGLCEIQPLRVARQAAYIPRKAFLMVIG